MSNKKYTHLFFDLDNTLWDFSKNSYFAMQVAFKQHLKKNSLVEFKTFFDSYSQINKLLWNDYRDQLISKKELTKLRFQKTFDKLGIKNVDANEMNSTYLDEMPKQLYLIEGALPVLKHLKSRGYQLSIISNGFSEVQYKKIENTGLSEYFYKIFLSSEVKTPKPGLEIFEYAVKSTNARKRNSLMIGDDWEVDICGASNFGMDAVYFSREWNEYNSKINKVGKSINIYYIHKLSQLISLL